MNLPPTWVPVIEEAGHAAVHWSSVGSSNAPDREILAWAKAKGYVLFTHDLDFGTILAATDTEAPSVIEIRNRAALQGNGGEGKGEIDSVIQVSSDGFRRIKEGVKEGGVYGKHSQTIHRQGSAGWASFSA